MSNFLKEHVGSITLGSVFTFLVTNLTKITAVLLAVYTFGKPFVDSYIVAAVAEQKFVNQQSLNKVIEDINEANKDLGEISNTLKRIEREYSNRAIRDEFTQKSLEKLETYQFETNRNILIILRELKQTGPINNSLDLMNPANPVIPHILNPVTPSNP